VVVRVALVSCVKVKKPVVSAAQDLYVSGLFKGMRSYAQANADRWFILSAEHGLLAPDQIVAPYERTLNRMRQEERVEWARRVQSSLIERLPTGATVIFLAGVRYRENLVQFLEDHGFPVTVPMSGLKLGHQLQWLKARNQP
jgi:hypothetical protein